MDSTDGGPGHVLIQDKATGKVWDVNDGEPPADASTWHYATSADWAAAQPRSATGQAAFSEAGTMQVGAVREILALPGEQRAQAIAASGDPAMLRLQASAYSMAGNFPPVIRVQNTVGEAVSFSYSNTLRVPTRRGYVPDTPLPVQDRSNLLLYNLLYGPGTDGEGSLEAMNAWSKLSPAAQAMYCAYVYSIAEPQANMPTTIYAGNGAPILAIPDDHYSLTQYLNAAEDGPSLFGNFAAAAGAEYDKNWHPPKDPDDEADATRVLSGSQVGGLSYDRDGDGCFDEAEMIAWAKDKGVSLSPEQAHTLILLYARDPDHRARVTAEEMGQIDRKSVV